MMKYNKTPSKMYKQLVQQKVQQNMQQKVQQKVQQKKQQKVHNNYVSLLIKQFVFTKSMESLLNQNTKKIQFLNKFFCATRCTLRCAFCCEVLCSAVDFVVQFYLRARENKFHIARYPK